MPRIVQAQAAAPAFIVNADGSMTLVGSTSTLVGVEAQVRPPTTVFGYFGDVRIDREIATDGTAR